jgi:hypothetical protein
MPRPDRRLVPPRGPGCGPLPAGRPGPGCSDPVYCVQVVHSPLPGAGTGPTRGTALNIAAAGGEPGGNCYLCGHPRGEMRPVTIAAVNGQGNPAAWRPRFRVETAGAVLSARGRHYGVGHPGCSGDGAGRAVEKRYQDRAVGAVDSGVFRYLAERGQQLAVPASCWPFRARYFSAAQAGPSPVSIAGRTGALSSRSAPASTIYLTSTGRSGEPSECLRAGGGHEVSDRARCSGAPMHDPARRDRWTNRIRPRFTDSGSCLCCTGRPT